MQQIKQHTEPGCACDTPVKETPVGGCACGDGHAHAHAGSGKKRMWIELGISAAFMLLGFIPWPLEWLGDAFFVLSAVIAGYPVFISGIRGLARGKMEENLLMSIASIAAIVIQEFFEGAAVALFFRIGEVLEEYASERSRKQIQALSEIQPDTANILQADGTMQAIAAANVLIGSTIVVLPHERVPLDGGIVSGQSTLDAAALTGESLPRSAMPGDAVSSGMMNGSGTLRVRTTQELNQSAAARVIQMVEEAVERKGSAQKTITRFARVYTPIVVVLAALLLVVPSLITGDWATWVRTALGFLVASCPCALVLSVPLGFFSGIGAAAKQGVIVKGGIFLEHLAKAKTFVFDKTGTLTTEEMQVTQVTTAAGMTEQEVLRLAAACEWHSTHPLAKAIVREATQEVNEAEIQEFAEIPGGGTRAVYLGRTLHCGGKRLMQQEGISLAGLPDAAVYLAVDGQAVGAISFAGTLQPDAKETLARLRSAKGGVERVIMLTGDSATQAAPVAQELELDEYHAELLPEDKLRIVEEIKEAGGGVVYVGDGINDAPVLALSDAGVAMGLGTQAASEAADIILTGSQLHRLADARQLFRKTMRIVNFNIVFSLLVKIAVMGLLLLPMVNINISAAVFADVGVLIITVLNASRILRIKKSD